ncbi:UDP-xylose transporter 1 [Asimina triloba]
MAEASGFQLGVIGALALSVVSSVAIVICNKALISTLEFPFVTTLTSWHLMVTFCTLHVAQRFNVFEPKSTDMKVVMLFGLLNGISIGFLNLSLGFNSVGFYQMTKLAIIPFTVLLETVFLKKQFSERIKLSLLVLLLGVGIASVTDLNLNLLGSIVSLFAIATTCVSQIKKLNVSSTQLLHQSAPFQAAVLFVCGPLVDQCLTKKNVFAYRYSPIVLTFIILSCLISVSVNFSTFLVIGETSPVTYQVLGHLKTCLILTFGYTLLHDPFTIRNIIGILVAILGMGLYSYFCTRQSRRINKQSDDVHNIIIPPTIISTNQVKDTTVVPLLGSMTMSHHHDETKKVSNKDSLITSHRCPSRATTINHPSVDPCRSSEQPHLHNAGYTISATDLHAYRQISPRTMLPHSSSAVPAAKPIAAHLLFQETGRFPVENYLLPLCIVSSCRRNAATIIAVVLLSGGKPNNPPPSPCSFLFHTTGFLIALFSSIVPETHVQPSPSSPMDKKPILNHHRL